VNQSKLGCILSNSTLTQAVQYKIAFADLSYDKNISYAVFAVWKKKKTNNKNNQPQTTN